MPADRCLRFLPLLVVFVFSAIAQQDSVVFRTGVTLVEVSVVVRDANGQPVLDLQREDFRILANGQEWQILSFAEPQLSAGAQREVEPLPPGVFTNAPERNRDSRGLVVILVDSLNTCVTDQMQMKRQLVDFLRTNPANTRFALYSVGNELQVLHDFTSQPEALIERLQGIPLDAATPQPVQSEDQQTAPIRDGRMDTFAQADRMERQLRFWLDEQRTLSDNVRYDQRVRNSLGALETIIRRMNSAPGKKSIIWLSGGFQEMIGQPELGGRPSDQTGFSTQAKLPDEVFDLRSAFQGILTYANRTGVTIYPMDSRGLTPFGDISPAVCDGIHAGVKLQNQQVLQEAAKVTGGLAVVNTNRLGGGLETIFREIDGTYTLGFYVAAEHEEAATSPRGRNRGRRGQRDNPGLAQDYPLQISVAKPGLQVAHRVRQNAATEMASQSGDRLQTLLESPVDSAGLVFLAGILGPAEQPDKMMLQIIIPTSSLQFEQDGSRSRTTVRLGAIARSADGKQLHGEATTVRATLTAEQMEQARQMGLILRHAVTVPANATSLRVAIAEAQYGLTGSLTIDLPNRGQ